jgi:F0F1-type ATP synthase assembly protein I
MNEAAWYNWLGLTMIISPAIYLAISLIYDAFKGEAIKVLLMIVYFGLAVALLFWGS